MKGKNGDFLKRMGRVGITLRAGARGSQAVMDEGTAIAMTKEELKEFIRNKRR